MLNELLMPSELRLRLHRPINGPTVALREYSAHDVMPKAYAVRSGTHMATVEGTLWHLAPVMFERLAPNEASIDST